MTDKEPLLKAIRRSDASMSYIATIYEDNRKNNEAIISRWGEGGLRFIQREARIHKAWET